MNATQFTFNILKASEYLFHLRADFPDTKDPVGAIVRNSTSRGEWLREDRHMNSFPFSPGITFDMIVTAAPDHLKVEVNGSHFCNFTYRPNIKPGEVDTITVVGDLTIQKFELL
uniref:Galectin n=1 Tax=Acrobeloides nanus TaxID=290746 RepID=A0A914CYU0_9BILA